MSVLKYTVVVADSGREIAGVVQQHLDTGWRLHGDLTSRRYEYAQAMSRMKTQEELAKQTMELRKGEKDVG